MSVEQAAGSCPLLLPTPVSEALPPLPKSSAQQRGFERFYSRRGSAAIG